MSFKPTREQIDAAFLHADMVQPFESCGVIADGHYMPMRNEAEDKNSFTLDMHAYRKIASEHAIEAVVHSHVNLPPLASDADRAGCESTALPWLIITWPDKAWALIRPSGWQAPLVGRQWAWGTLDCFALVRDGFRAYTGIEIPDFDRDYNWWRRGGDIISRQYLKAGFVEMPQGTEPQHCDVIGMRVNSPVVNHLGLYIWDPAKGGMLLHQLYNRLSVREIYGGIYLSATELHLRHQNFLQAPPK